MRGSDARARNAKTYATHGLHETEGGQGQRCSGQSDKINASELQRSLNLFAFSACEAEFVLYCVCCSDSQLFFENFH